MDKRRRSFNTSTAYPKLWSILGKLLHLPENSRKTYLINAITNSDLYKSPNVSELSHSRYADTDVRDNGDLSCSNVTYSEKRRQFCYQLISTEQLYSTEVMEVISQNPVRILLSIIDHFKIECEALSWMIEEICYPVPVFLVACKLILPDKREFYYRIDISRLQLSIWEYQDIFYKSINYPLKKKGEDFPIRSEMTDLERIGPGKPFCWQSIKNDHDYSGDAKDVWLELLLSEGGKRYNFPIFFFWDRFMTKTYRIAFVE